MDQEEKLIKILKEAVQPLQPPPEKKKLPELFWTALSMSVLAAVTGLWLSYSAYQNHSLRQQVQILQEDPVFQSPMTDRSPPRFDFYEVDSRPIAPDCNSAEMILHMPGGYLECAGQQQVEEIRGWFETRPVATEV